MWSEGTLLANVSENRPAFLVRGLPPAAPLRLVLYSATPHARSTPVVKYARTLPRPPLHLTGQWVGGWRGLGPTILRKGVIQVRLVILIVSVGWWDEVRKMLESNMGGRREKSD